MTGAVWARPQTPTTAICRACHQPFAYVRRNNKPRVRCDGCRRSRKLSQIRVHCTEYRRLEKIRLGIA